MFRGLCALGAQALTGGAPHKPFGFEPFGLELRVERLKVERLRAERFTPMPAYTKRCTATRLGKFKRCRIGGLGRALQKSISKNQLVSIKDCHVNGLWMILRIISTHPINLWDDLPDEAKGRYSLIFTGT
jgi:hypothetical protein